MGNILGKSSLQYSPYFDDFFKTEHNFAKNYKQILFVPGRPLQSRELNQIQSIINDNIKNHFDTVYKNGSVIYGGEYIIKYVSNVPYICIKGLSVYFDGNMFLIDEILYDISAITTSKNIMLGMIVNYNIISNDGNIVISDDTDEKYSLLDPAIKYFENEYIIGADRLSVSFALIDNEDYDIIINSGTDELHYFKIANIKINFSNNIHTIDDFNYFIQKDTKKTSVLDDEILTGLQITNNIDTTDLNSSSYLQDKIICTVNSGIGRLDDSFVSLKYNKVLVFDCEKYDNTIGNNFSEEIYVNKLKKSGIYFTAYYDNSFNPEQIGISDINVGDEIIIQRNFRNMWENVAIAKINSIDYDTNNNNNDLRYSSLYTYWEQNSNFINVNAIYSPFATESSFFIENNNTFVCDNNIFDNAYNNGSSFLCKTFWNLDNSITNVDSTKIKVSKSNFDTKYNTSTFYEYTNAYIIYGNTAYEIINTSIDGTDYLFVLSGVHPFTSGTYNITMLFWSNINTLPIYNNEKFYFDLGNIRNYFTEKFSTPTSIEGNIEIYNSIWSELSNGMIISDIDESEELKIISVPPVYGKPLDVNSYTWYNINSTTNRIFHKVFVENNNGLYKNTSILYGTNNSLKTLYIYNKGFNYNKVFIDNLNMLGTSSAESFFNDAHQSYRIMIIDKFPKLIQKCVGIYITNDVQYDSNNYYYQSIDNIKTPFVKDLNRSYNIFANRNLNNITLTDFDIEGNLTWAKINFNIDQKILGVRKCYGIKSDIHLNYKIGLMLYDVDNLEISSKIEIPIDSEYFLFNEKQTCKDLFWDIYHNTDEEKNLGINIYKFEDSNYIKNITFFTASKGLGSSVDETRAYQIIKNGKKVNVVDPMYGVNYKLKMTIDNNDIYSFFNNTYYTNDLKKDFVVSFTGKFNNNPTLDKVFEKVIVHNIYDFDITTPLTNKYLEFNYNDENNNIIPVSYSFSVKDNMSNLYLYETIFCLELLLSVTIKNNDKVYDDNDVLIGSCIADSSNKNVYVSLYNYEYKPSSNDDIKIVSSGVCNTYTITNIYAIEYDITQLQEVTGTMNLYVIPNQEVKLENGNKININSFEECLFENDAAIMIKNTIIDNNNYNFLYEKYMSINEYYKSDILIDYIHKGLKVNTNDNVNITVKNKILFSGSYLLPQNVNIYLNSDNKIETKISKISSELDYSILSDKLFIGSLLIPPCYSYDGKTLSYKNNGEYISNYSLDLKKYIESYKLNKTDVKLNKINESLRLSSKDFDIYKSTNCEVTSYDKQKNKLYGNNLNQFTTGDIVCFYKNEKSYPSNYVISINILPNDGAESQYNGIYFENNTQWVFIDNKIDTINTGSNFIEGISVLSQRAIPAIGFKRNHIYISNGIYNQNWTEIVPTDNMIVSILHVLSTEITIDKYLRYDSLTDTWYDINISYNIKNKKDKPDVKCIIAQNNNYEMTILNNLYEENWFSNNIGVIKTYPSIFLNNIYNNISGKIYNYIVKDTTKCYKVIKQTSSDILDNLYNEYYSCDNIFNNNNLVLNNDEKYELNIDNKYLTTNSSTIFKKISYQINPNISFNTKKTIKPSYNYYIIDTKENITNNINFDCSKNIYFCDLKIIFNNSNGNNEEYVVNNDIFHPKTFDILNISQKNITVEKIPMYSNLISSKKINSSTNQYNINSDITNFKNENKEYAGFVEADMNLISQIQLNSFNNLIGKCAIIGIDDMYNIVTDKFNSTSYILDTNTSLQHGKLEDLVNTLNKLNDGLYKLNVIFGKNLEPVSSTNSFKYITDEHIDLVKLTSTIRLNNNNRYDNYDYIQNQIISPTLIYKYNDVDDRLKTKINSSTSYADILKYNILPENWLWVAPETYQVYSFSEDQLLNNIDFFLDYPASNNHVYSGNIIVCFGFLIDDVMTEEGIIHTEFISDLNLNTFSNKHQIILTTPIYIPKNTKFFIGFIKEYSQYANTECLFSLVENGKYDINNDMLISFPNNSFGYLIDNGIQYSNKMLKINLGVNEYTIGKYELISDNYVLNDEYDVFSCFDNIVIANNTSVEYLYSTNNGDNWFYMDLNKDIVLDSSVKTFRIKTILTTYDKNVSPIINSEVIVVFKYKDVSTISTSYIPNGYWKNLNYNTEYSYIGFDINMSNQMSIYKYDTITIAENVIETTDNFYDNSNGVKYAIKHTDIIKKIDNIVKNNMPYNILYTIQIEYETNIFSEAGIPILFRDTTGEIIPSYSDEFYVGSGDSYIMNNFINTQYEDMDITWNSNNKYGKILNISQIEKNKYSQTYQFLGKTNWYENNIKMTIFLPLMKNVSGHYSAVKIKNIIVNIDVITEIKFVDIQKKDPFNFTILDPIIYYGG
jgi:hypothetical protein